MSCLSPIFSIRKLKKQISNKKRSSKSRRSTIEGIIMNTESVWFNFPLLDLPSCVLIKILSILPVSDLAKTSESCRYLYELSQHNSVWRKSSKLTWGAIRDDAVMRPTKWKQYYSHRHIVNKEGAFEWENTTPKGDSMSKRYQHTGSVVGQDIYFIGGQELPDRRFDDIYVLHTNTMQLAKVKVTGAMPKFARHTAVPIGQKIYLFGGFDGVSQHFHLSVFDTRTNTWCNPYVGGECPPSRTNHSATSIGDKMFLFGGMFKDPGSRLVFLDDLYMLDTSNNQLTWNRLPQYGERPAARCGHRLLSVGGKLILFGGGSGEQWDKKYSDVHVYDPATYTWTKPKVTGSSAPVCTFTIAFAASNFLFVFGGQSVADNNLTNDLYCLDLTGLVWKKITVAGACPSARDMASGNIVGSKMYMYGGYCGAAIDSFHTLKMNPKLMLDATPAYSMSPLA